MAKLGFVGLGVMGGNMVARLLEKGHTVTGYNRTRSKAQWLIDKGMKFADSPKAVAAASDVTFTMVTNAAALACGHRRPGWIARRPDSRQVPHRYEHGEPRSKPRAGRESSRKGRRHDRRSSFRQRHHSAARQTLGHGRRPQRNLRAYEAIAARYRSEGNARRRQRRGTVHEDCREPQLAVQMLAFSEGVLLAEKSGSRAKLRWT